MQKTIEQRIEWLEEINKLVSKDEFRERMKGENIKFRIVEVKVHSVEKTLIAHIIMVDGRISTMRWFLGVFIGIGIGILGTIIAYGQILINLAK